MSLSRRAAAFSVFCQAASMAVAVCFLNQIAKFHDGSKRFGSSPIKGGLGPLAAGFLEQRRPFYPPPVGGRYWSAQAGGAQNTAELSGLQAAWIYTCSMRSLKMRTQRLSHRTHTCRPIYSGGGS